MDYEQLQQYQQSLLDRALSEGIRRNDEQTKTWSDYKERHEKEQNDILDSLEKERNLFVMRQNIPNTFDAFGSDVRKDLVEHWDNEKLDDWRVQHRQREKEYRKKLAELRSTDKPEIQSEDDLFNKLDALELQEELEDELHRLEAARPDFYTQDLEDGEVYEESESETGSDASDNMEDESTSENDEKTLNIDEPTSSTAHTTQSSSMNQIHASNSITGIASSQKINEVNNIEGRSEPITLRVMEPDAREKKVFFGESRVKYFNNSDKIEAISQDSTAEEPGSSEQTQMREIESSDDKDDDEMIRIEFKHSDCEPEIPDVENESIESPRDIYRMLSKPKSILKKSLNHVPQYDNYVPPVDYSTDEEIEDVPTGVSAYSTVVKEIREHIVDAAVGKPIESVEQKRPVSKFKRERANMKR